MNVEWLCIIKSIYKFIKFQDTFQHIYTIQELSEIFNFNSTILMKKFTGLSKYFYRNSISISQPSALIMFS